MNARGSSTVGWMVGRARHDAFFLGRMLSEYQEANGLDDRALAAALKCTPHALSRLILCRCPDDRAVAFAEQVQTIAAFAACSADALMQVLRHVAAMRALRAQGESGRGLLLAARDRHDDEQSTKSNGMVARKRRRHRK